MFEVPSLLYAPEALYETADFMSVGGNDLLQFFFAADRENERVGSRYDSLNLSYLSFLEAIVTRCQTHGTRLSFCGEAAGNPTEALALAALGFRELSMRPSSIGPVKQALLRVKLEDVRGAIEAARNGGCDLGPRRPAIGRTLPPDQALTLPGNRHSSAQFRRELRSKPMQNAA